MSGSATKKRGGGGPTTIAPVAVSATDDAAKKADLASLFECPVCFDYALPPIYQCASGHLICSECRPKMTSCPTCRGPLANIRNLAMEKVALTVPFPCKHSGNGCATLVFHAEKAKHEETCEYRPYPCIFPSFSNSCKWTGSLDQVTPHILSCHEPFSRNGHRNKFKTPLREINRTGPLNWVMMISCLGQNFLFLMRKQDRQGSQHFYAMVQMIGSKKQSEKYAYCLELKCPRRSLVQTSTPISIDDDVKTAIQQSECLSFDVATAQRFVVDGNFYVGIHIITVEKLRSMTMARSQPDNKR